MNIEHALESANHRSVFLPQSTRKMPDTGRKRYSIPAPLSYAIILAVSMAIYVICCWYHYSGSEGLANRVLQQINISPKRNEAVKYRDISLGFGRDRIMRKYRTLPQSIETLYWLFSKCAIVTIWCRKRIWNSFGECLASVKVLSHHTSC